jgi:hypothetical protein
VKLAPALLLFGLLSGLVTFWFSPLSNIMSRKHEYEADDFARVAMQWGGPVDCRTPQTRQQESQQHDTACLVQWILLLTPHLGGAGARDGRVGLR